MSEKFRLTYLRHAGITSGNIRTQMRELHRQLREPSSTQAAAFEEAVQFSRPMKSTFSCPAGMPVLFVHGHRGSAPQVSSFAAHSVAARRGTLFSANADHVQLSWFSIDFHEASTAFHAGLMRAQAAYLNDAVASIRAWYGSSTCSPVTDDGEPPPVQLVAHSMGGMLARLAVLLPNHEPGSFTSVLSLNSPHQAHPVDTDASAAALYRHVNHLWHAAAIGRAPQHLTHITTLFLASITSGYSDPLVRPDLTRLDGLVPPSRSLWAPLDAIPSAWCSSGHQNIVACGPFLSRVVRTLHAAAAVAAAGGNTTAEATALLWHNAMLRPMGLAPPVRVASASQQLQAERDELSDWKHAFSLGVLPVWLTQRTKLSDGVYLTASVGNRVVAVSAQGQDMASMVTLGTGQQQQDRQIIGRAEGEMDEDDQRHVGDVPSDGALRVCVRAPAALMPALAKRELLVTLVSNQPPPCAVRGGRCTLGPGAARPLSDHSAVTWQGSAVGAIQDNSLLPNRQYPLLSHGMTQRVAASWAAGDAEHGDGPTAPHQLTLDAEVAQLRRHLPRHALSATIPYAFSGWTARGRLPPPPLAMKTPSICLHWPQRKALVDSTWLYMHVGVAPRASSGIQALQAPQAQQHSFQVLSHWSMLLNPAAWMAWLVTGEAVFTSVTWRMQVGAPPLTWLGLRGAGQLVQLHPFLGYQVSVTATECGAHQAPPATPSSQVPAMWHAVAFGDVAAGSQALWHSAPIVAHSSAADRTRADSSALALAARELAALLLGWPRLDQGAQESGAFGGDALGGAGAPAITNHWLKVIHFANTSAVPALSLLSDPRCSREVRLTAAPSSILLAWLPQRLPWLLCTLCSVIMLHLVLAQGLWVSRRIAWKRGKRLWRARLWEYACHLNMGGVQGGLPQPQLPQYARYPSLAHVQRHLWLPLLLLSLAMAVASASLRAALHPPLDWQRGAPHPGLGIPIEWLPMSLREHLALHALSLVLVAAYCRLLSGISRIFGWGAAGLNAVSRTSSHLLQVALRRGWLPAGCMRRCGRATACAPPNGFLEVAYRKRTSSHTVDDAHGREGEGGLDLPPLEALEGGHDSGDGRTSGWRSIWDVLLQHAVPAAERWNSQEDGSGDEITSPAAHAAPPLASARMMPPPRVTPHVQDSPVDAHDDGSGVMLGLRRDTRHSLRQGMLATQSATHVKGGGAHSTGLQLGAEISLGFESDSTEPDSTPAQPPVNAAQPPQQAEQGAFRVGIRPPLPASALDPPPSPIGRIHVRLPSRTPEDVPHTHSAPDAHGSHAVIPPGLPPLHVRTLSSNTLVSPAGGVMSHEPPLIRSTSMGGLSAAASASGAAAVSPLHSSLALSSMALTSKSTQRAALGLRSLTLGVTMPRVSSQASLLHTPSATGSLRGIGVGAFDIPSSPALGRRATPESSAQRMPSQEGSAHRSGSTRRGVSRGDSGDWDSLLAQALASEGDSRPVSREGGGQNASGGGIAAPHSKHASHTDSYSSTGSAGALPPPLSVAAAAALSFHSRAAAAAAAAEEGGSGSSNAPPQRLSSISRALLAGNNNGTSPFVSQGGLSVQSDGAEGGSESAVGGETAQVGDHDALLLSMPDRDAQEAIGHEMATLWAVQDAEALNSAIRGVHWIVHAPVMLLLHAVMRCTPPSSRWGGLIRSWDRAVQSPDAWLLSVPKQYEQQDAAASAPVLSASPPLEESCPPSETQPSEQTARSGTRLRATTGAPRSDASELLVDTDETPPQASARGACWAVLQTFGQLGKAALQQPKRLLAFLRGISSDRAALLVLLLASASAWLALVSIALVMPWLVVTGAFTGLLLQTLLAAATLPPAALLHRAVQAQAAAGSASAVGPLSHSKGGGRTRTDSVADANEALVHFATGAAVAGEAALNETRHQEGIVLLYLLLLLSKATSVMYTAEATLQLRHPFHRDVLLALPMALELFAARAGKPMSNSAQLLGQVFLLVVFSLVSQGFMYSIAPAIAMHAALSLCARMHHGMAHTTIGKIGTALYRRFEFILTSLPLKVGRQLRCVPQAGAVQ